MKTIKLTKGYFTIVDDKDFDVLNKYKWHICAGYAARLQYPERKYIYMHRQILEAHEKQVDHINYDKLDNRRCNLREATKGQNMANTKLRRTNKSGFKGVTFYKAYKKWAAEITINYKRISLGYFDNKENAAKAYNKAAIKYFGEYARLNPV